MVWQSFDSATMANKTTQMNLIPIMILTHILLFSAHVSASANDHRYNVGDKVPLFVNKIGPLHNPSETYHYYDLAFCSPEPVIQKTETLGEVLNGDRLTNSVYELNFREGQIRKSLCKKKLKVSEIVKFRDAVMNDYYFQMYYDDLPLWAFVGKVEDLNWSHDDKRPKYYIFKHVQFDALYNDNQIVEIQAFSDPNHVVDITEDVEIDVEFTYSINWTATSAPFKNRMDKYSKASLLPIRQKMHWFSFMNSIVAIFLMLGFLSMLIMRRLKHDLRSVVDLEEDKEVGWKYIHGDVFRCPSNMSLFCGFLGIGTQLLILICILFFLAFFGVLFPYNRGALLSSLVLGYALTSVVAGYTAASFYSKFSESGWPRSVILTGVLYIGPLFGIMSILNTVAIAKGATSALPFGTIVVIVLIYVFLSIPLLILGGLIGHSFRSDFSPPCATNPHPREIPTLAWYRNTSSQMFLAGLLPFSAIILQLDHLYLTMWGYKIFTLPGILFLTFFILIILTAILSIGLTYIQLSGEDHRWWWRSVLNGGSTAIFMFGYGIYFYRQSNMTGLMQFLFFHGYHACLTYALFLVLATISFHVSLMFVRYIYRAVKSE